jgi:UDP-N-acetylglucosamine 2-epimerase
MKMVTVVGTRPNLIKMSILSKEIRKRHEEVLIDTGQHYDDNMSTSFYRDLDIPNPDYNLQVGSSTHAHHLASMIVPLEEILERIKPDYVLVHGDTNSTLAGALSAAKMNIPVVHVESGLRSFDRYMPEEVNRIIVDHISRICCCPTDNSVWNLECEGVDIGRGYYTINTGDIMLDMINNYMSKALNVSTIIDNLCLDVGQYYLTTVHRVSNTDDSKKLGSILKNLQKLGDRVVFPIHPRTRKLIASYGLSVPENVLMIDPVGYFDMMALIKFSNRVITDSGGVQKEAYFIGTPCITLRDTTEWIETNAGFWNICVGKDFDRILSASEIVPDKERINLCKFGNGCASQNTVTAIEYYNGLMEEWIE